MILRYFPICIADKHGLAANVVNWPQNQMHPLGHALESLNQFSTEFIEAKGGVEKCRQETCQQMLIARGNPVCRRCAAESICLGVSKEYARKFGLDELTPYNGRPITDPLHFVKLGVEARKNDRGAVRKPD